MKRVFHTYAPDESIPVETHLRNRKLKKYFNRETAAAIVAVGELLTDESVDTATTGIYYATGRLEFEDYGLETIATLADDGAGGFSQRNFVDKALQTVSPLAQFKILPNMPLSFVTIEFGFTADNACVYADPAALLLAARCGGTDTLVLGAGKTYRDGSVTMGFALCRHDELDAFSPPSGCTEAVELFRSDGRSAI